MNKTKAKLILQSGEEFEGISFGFEKSVAGEVVFNTSMTGYPESLSDPSYKGQILVATYPIVGNYGVPNQSHDNYGISEHFESDKIHLSAIVISDYTENYSHWEGEKSLGDWLKENQIPGIFGIDTRELTQLIRERGSILGKIIITEDIDFNDPNTENLVNQVSTKQVTIIGEGKNKILVIDCGMKNNILRHLLKRETKITRVPWDYNFEPTDFDGIFISNGPGDPKKCEATIKNLGLALTSNKPIFGICLGSQLLALASGADTYKLPYGHRGHNQPVINCEDQRAYITSQNHGYAVDEQTLNPDWKPFFKNLNDGTIEGIKHKSKPIMATQFHPEASGGPEDTEFLFDDFIEMIEKSKKSH